MKKINEIQIVVATAIVVCLCVSFSSYHFGKSSVPTVSAEVQYWQQEYNEVLGIAHGFRTNADETIILLKKCTGAFAEFKNGE